MHSQHAGDCVLTIKRTESGRPNKHNNADTRDTWPCYWYSKWKWWSQARSVEKKSCNTAVEPNVDASCRRAPRAPLLRHHVTPRDALLRRSIGGLRACHPKAHTCGRRRQSSTSQDDAATPPVLLALESSL
eukprot:4194755-Prymnesium_polylepis.1